MALKNENIEKLIPPVHMGWNHGLLLSFGSTCLFILNKESVSTSWRPAEVICFFEHFDLLWIKLNNVGLILIILILCSFLVILLKKLFQFQGKTSKGTCWLNLVRIQVEDNLAVNLCISGKCNLPYLCFGKIKALKYFSCVTESLPF